MTQLFELRRMYMRKVRKKYKLKTLNYDFKRQFKDITSKRGNLRALHNDFSPFQYIPDDVPNVIEECLTFRRMLGRIFNSHDLLNYRFYILGVRIYLPENDPNREFRFKVDTAYTKRKASIEFVNKQILEILMQYFQDPNKQPKTSPVEYYVMGFDIRLFKE